MADFKYDFANPSVHADWAKYAGLNRVTGSYAPPPSTATRPAGVKPPGSFSEMWDEEVKPLQESWNSAKQIGSHLIAGNFNAAYNAAVDPNSQNKSPQDTTSPVSNPYNYQGQLEDEEVSSAADAMNTMGEMASAFA
jgi:hypothetical protein